MITGCDECGTADEALVLDIDSDTGALLWAKCPSCASMAIYFERVGL